MDPEQAGPGPPMGSGGGACGTTIPRSKPATEERPFVSVVVPIRNEGRHLEQALASILAQDYPPDRLEILCVDGASEDDSPAVIDRLAQHDPRVRRLSNPDRIAPCGFNVGIRAARGEYVAIMGAHTEYAPNYLSASIEAILDSGADAAGGVLQTAPGSPGLIARAIAHVLTHRFGVGGSEFRMQDRPGGKWVTGVPFPVFRASVFQRIGLYDPRLVRNQDNDLHVRLQDVGGRMYRSPDTWCRYRARSTLRGLIRYAFDYGRYHVPLVRVNPSAFRLFYFVPFGFVAAIILGVVCGGLFSWWPLIVLASVYAAANLAATLHVAATRRVGLSGVLVLPVAFAAFHLSYGVGTWAGLFQFGLSPRFRRRSGVPD